MPPPQAAPVSQYRRPGSAAQSAAPATASESSSGVGTDGLAVPSGNDSQGVHAPGDAQERHVNPDVDSVIRRRGSFGGTLKAVAWSFLGIRGSQAHEADVARLNPLHVIAAGILCALLFILVLVVIVRMVVG